MTKQKNHPIKNVIRALDVQVGGQHYKTKEIQPIEFCLANKLGASESAVVKYVTRWEEKGGLKDLQKAKHYLELLMEDVEQNPHRYNLPDTN